MARKGSKKRSETATVAEGRSASHSGIRAAAADQESREALDRWRPWLLAGAAAVLVARPLYPSETPADTGDGLPIVMLWLALAGVWMLGLLGRRRFQLRFGLLDALVVFLVVWHVASAVLAASHAHARPAVNMLWEWVGLGLVFVLIRQWVAGPKEVRALVVVMLGLAVALAGYGLFQCVYEFPRTRATYHADPEKALQEAGFFYPPGSPERIAFEKRLESREPIGTFALSNSLAGFLTPWLVVAWGIGLLGGGWSAGWRPRLALLAGGLLVGACLLLTKSRSAYLALLAGGSSLAGWWLWLRLNELRNQARLSNLGSVLPQPSYRFWLPSILGFLGLLAGGGVMIGLAFYWGGLDIQVLTEAGKSLQYRWEYWQATWQIIRHEPLWGCGPGLFRYAYTRFKLPQASEEIADPHHFLLEIWATAGTPAALTMLLFLAFWTVQVGRLVAGSHFLPLPPIPSKTTQSLLAPTESLGKILLGGGVGVALGFGIGQWSAAPPSLYFWMVGLPLGVAMVWGLWPWVQTVHRPTALPLGFSEQNAPAWSANRWIKFLHPEYFPGILAGGVGALLVHLLAAGGISFGGVAGSLWLLAALATGPAGMPSTLTPGSKKASPMGAEERGKLGKKLLGFSSPTETQAESPSKNSQAPGGWNWLAWLDRQHRLSWPGAIGGLVCTLAIFFACHQTAFSPVLQCKGLIQQAFRLASTDRQRAEKLLHQAARTDPFSAVPAEWLSELAFQDWQERFLQRPGEPAYWRPRLRQWEQYAFLALELNPQDALAWFVQGQRFLSIGKVLLHQGQWPTEARRAMQKALGCFQQAASLYPNNALYRAQLAETFAALGYQPGMIREAKNALWLDQQMPHPEKKLPETLRAQLIQMQSGIFPSC